MRRALVVRSAVLAAIVLSLAGVLAQAASAQYVYTRLGSELWVMNDDGSGAHQVLSAADLAGVGGIEWPAVAPGGGTVVFSGTWSQAGQEQGRWTPLAPVGSCGINCDGVYSWSAGHAQRLSPDPSPCPSAPCSVLWDQPEIDAGGQVLSAYLLTSNVTFCDTFGCSWSFSNYDAELKSEPAGVQLASGSDPQVTTISTPCAGDSTDGNPTGPSPDPANAQRIAFVCRRYDHATLYAQDRDGGNRVLLAQDTSDPMADPSWSPDGSRVVVVDQPGLTANPSPGLYVAKADGSGSTYALAESEDHFMSAPRFVAGGKIALGADGEIFTIPDTCGQSGTPCQFPADATQITHDGNIDDLAWTSQTLSAPPTGGGGSGGGGAGGGGSSGSGGAGGSGSGGGAAAQLSFAGVAHQHLRTLTHGLKVRVGCSRACRLTVSLQLDARTARALRLGRRKLTLAHRTVSLSAGHGATLALKPSRKALRALRRARRVTFVVIESAGPHGPRLTRHVTLAR